MNLWRKNSLFESKFRKMIEVVKVCGWFKVKSCLHLWLWWDELGYLDDICWYRYVWCIVKLNLCVAL